MPDNGGVYFVPAFGGLLAPWWQDDARGVIVGLTQYSTKVLPQLLQLLNCCRLAAPVQQCALPQHGILPALHSWVP